MDLLYINALTPLHCAIETGQYDTFVFLAKNGADINAKERNIE